MNKQQQHIAEIDATETINKIFGYSNKRKYKMTDDKTTYKCQKCGARYDVKIKGNNICSCGEKMNYSKIRIIK